MNSIAERPTPTAGYMQRPSILVIDNDPNTLRAVNHYLRRNYLIIPVTSGREAFRFLEQKTADLILLDLDMPGENGYELLERLKQTPETSSAPVILMSGGEDAAQSSTRGFELGASDCIRKPFSMQTLENRIEKLLSGLKESPRRPDSAEFRSGAGETAHSPTVTSFASLDRLTGLLNRETFMAEVKTCIRNHRNGALLLIDIDECKKVNDTFGQQGGDKLIRTVAGRLRSCISGETLLCRLDGDSFAAFLPGYEDEELLRKCLSTIRFRTQVQVSFPERTEIITVSIGVSVFPKHGTTYDELFFKAENALMFVKQNGKSYFRIASSSRERNYKSVEMYELTEEGVRELLERRRDEESQAWIKFGEYRLVWHSYIRLMEYVDLKPVSVLFTLTVNEELSMDATAGRKLVEIFARRIGDHFRKERTHAIFAWYSTNQLLMLCHDQNDVQYIIPSLLSALAAELEQNGLTLRYEIMPGESGSSPAPSSVNEEGSLT